MAATSQEPIHVCITGAAGQIGYSLVFRIATGAVFGPDRQVVLHLLDIPQCMDALNGVVMELDDCAFPLLQRTIATSDLQVAFSDCDYALLVGAMPRREGMTRADLLKTNASIFETQGRALDQFAKKTCRILVVGNPANTNCLLAQRSAPSIPPQNFTCLTRLDHNRANAQIAMKAGVSHDAVQNVVIWGNHSSTQYPDITSGRVTVNGAVLTVEEACKDDAWLAGPFIECVQNRGAAIIAARKLSSAGSAAKAICDHVHDWHFGTAEGKLVSMGVLSTGNSYGVPDGLIYSFPLTIDPVNGWKIQDGIQLSDASKARLQKSWEELVSERDQAVTFLSSNI